MKTAREVWLEEAARTFVVSPNDFEVGTYVRTRSGKVAPIIQVRPKDVRGDLETAYRLALPDSPTWFWHHEVSFSRVRTGPARLPDAPPPVSPEVAAEWTALDIEMNAIGDADALLAEENGPRVLAVVERARTLVRENKHMTSEAWPTLARLQRFLAKHQVRGEEGIARLRARFGGGS